MAPVQNEVKAPSSEVKCCRCGGSKGSWDMFLPITQRGSFFQDSFFSNMQQHFDAAVRQVLDQWSGSDLRITDRTEDANIRHGDVLGRYRRLRSVDLKEENQAVTVTSDDTSHKVVLDVHEFLGGDVRVKVVGERELQVEGRVDRKEEGSPCVTSHTFRRRFSLPRLTDMTAITSAMSSDGVLTITVPKLENEDQKTTIIPIKVEETQKNSQANASMTSGAQGTHKQEFKCEHCSREVVCNKEGVGETSLRSRDLREENQAVTSSEDERQHKFVLDVKDFSDGGEISVKAVSDWWSKAARRSRETGRGVLSGSFGASSFLETSSWMASPQSCLQTVCSPSRLLRSSRGSKSGNGISTPPKASSQVNSTPCPEGLSSSNQKGDSQQNTTAIPVKVQETGGLSERPTSSHSKTSTGVGDEDASARSSSLAAKGRGDADEGEQKEEDLYKLKGNGAKFPIKINGSVINNNSL
ncbi:heat shock protein 21 [Penaeus vannamei]|uniref:Heat shock protein 21 n=1 Tax=Penaeus vannamei TaxID=6689 RepID=A0A423SHG1_PENVA|nr:heat shock protein 21 [Penaeus vannamei]